MAATRNCILATHVGSLMRPPELLQFIDKMEAGEAVDTAAYDATLRSAVTEVVKRQHEAGIDIVSDGEFGKLRSWSFYVLDRLDGIEEQEVGAPTGAGEDQKRFPEFYAEYFPTQKLPKRGIAVAVGPIAYKGQKALANDIAVFKEALTKSDVTDAFLPVVAPASAVPRFPQRLLQERRGSAVRARRGDARGVSRDRRGGADGAGRRRVPALHVRRRLLWRHGGL